MKDGREIHTKCTHHSKTKKFKKYERVKSYDNLGITKLYIIVMLEK